MLQILDFVLLGLLVLLSTCSPCLAAKKMNYYLEVIGIPVGIGVVVIALLVMLIVCILQRRRKSRQKEAKRIADEQGSAETKRREFEEFERAEVLRRQREEEQSAEARRREIEFQQMAAAEEANRRQIEEQQAAESRKRLIGVPIIRETPPPAHNQYQYQPATYSNIERYEPYRAELGQAQPTPAYDSYLQQQRPKSEPQRKLQAGKNPFGFAERDAAWRPNSLHYDHEDKTEENPTEDGFGIPRAHHQQRHNSSTRRDEHRPVVPKKPTKYFNDSDTNIPRPDY